MIADIIEITDFFFIKEEFLLTDDTEKAFDSLDHAFLVSALKKLDLVRISLVGLKPSSQNKNLT